MILHKNYLVLVNLIFFATSVPVISSQGQDYDAVVSDPVSTEKVRFRAFM